MARKCDDKSVSACGIWLGLVGELFSRLHSGSLSILVSTSISRRRRLRGCLLDAKGKEELSEREGGAELVGVRGGGNMWHVAAADVA